MGQLIDRISQFVKSEFSDKTSFSSFNSFPDDEAELKRIIDELEKGNSANSSQKKKNDEKSNSSQTGDMTLIKAFDVIGISASASADEIKAAYIKRIKEYHPDKVAGLGEELRSLAEKKSQEINAAYSFIKQNKGL